MRGYRVHTGFWGRRHGTAEDVVRYEEEELGNDLHIPSDMRPRLPMIPATAIEWVCLTSKDARRYGDDVIWVEFDEVIGDDGEGGYLVVKGQENPS